MVAANKPRVLLWMSLPVVLVLALGLLQTGAAALSTVPLAMAAVFLLLWGLSLARQRWAAWTLGGLCCLGAALFLAATVSNLWLVPNLPAAAVLAPVALLFSALAWVLLFNRDVREWLRADRAEQTR